MTPKEQERLLRAYLNGHDSPEGKAIFEQWTQMLYEETSPISTTPEENVPELEQTIWAEIKQRTTKPKFKFSLKWGVGIGVAASILLCSIWAAQWFYQKEYLPESALHYQSIKTKAGEQAQVVMADGSKVFLNGATELRFPTELRGQTRHVYLEGEAFFEVAHNLQQPFIVSSKHLNTTVKGTTFNVHDFADDKTAQVSVLTGKVAVEMAENKLRNCLILPNQQCDFEEGKDQLTKSEVEEITESISWRQRKLQFKRAKMAAVFKELERMYGIHFIAKNPSLLECTWIASFENARLSEILDLMQTTLGIQYHINGKEVIITGICQ